ncbi:hypothetical protein [Streptomyces erythrochromogenes]|uniref:hypothetical protein n=1 Tax=Streptomyces erythrochromogenes TaxID=285574 RepID=UPI0036D09659
MALRDGQGQGDAADFAVDDEWDRDAHFSVGVLQDVELGREGPMVVQVLEERGPVGAGALGERDGPVSSPAPAARSAKGTGSSAATPWSA